jgi:hypothetical protein
VKDIALTIFRGRAGDHNGLAMQGGAAVGAALARAYRRLPFRGTGVQPDGLRPDAVFFKDSAHRELALKVRAALDGPVQANRGFSEASHTAPNDPRATLRPKSTPHSLTRMTRDIRADDPRLTSGDWRRPIDRFARRIG